jgi:hypothetical protein
VPGSSYTYELRRGDVIVATGHLTTEAPLEVGDRVALNGEEGIVRTITPPISDDEERLVVQLLPS